MREREREIGSGSAREVVVIDACPACGGIYLDKGELEKLTQFERDYDDRSRNRNRDRNDDDGGDDDDDGGGRGFLGRLFDNIGNIGD
jgi:Zn-finger nucleic acid-binding protein